MNMSQSTTEEVIWFEDPTRLFTRDTFLHFFPSADMTLEAKMNSLMRFSVYFFVVNFLFTKDYTMVALVMVTAAATAGMYRYNKDEDKRTRESFLKKGMAYSSLDKRACAQPTTHNPFMNVLMSDFDQNPERPPACDVDNDGVKGLISNQFNQSLFKDVDDIFGRKSSERQFYTTPNTKIPNDQDGFAKWLYETGPTCKEGNGVQCYANMYKPMSV